MFSVAAVSGRRPRTGGRTGAACLKFDPLSTPRSRLWGDKREGWLERDKGRTSRTNGSRSQPAKACVSEPASQDGRQSSQAAGTVIGSQPGQGGAQPGRRVEAFRRPFAPAARIVERRRLKAGGPAGPQGGELHRSDSPFCQLRYGSCDQGYKSGCFAGGS